MLVTFAAAMAPSTSKANDRCTGDTALERAARAHQGKSFLEVTMRCLRHMGLYNNPAACGLERSAPEYRLACKTIRSKTKR